VGSSALAGQIAAIRACTLSAHICRVPPPSTAKLCSSNLIAGCTEPDWPALAFTDSGRRRFSTQISTQKCSKAEPKCHMSWSYLQTGAVGQDASPAFQAGHAGSIPVARSEDRRPLRVYWPFRLADPGRRGLASR
jgi:hypothetical protein